MRAEFVPGARGALFLLRHEARDAALGNVVYLPPFAEEMNKCRRMSQLQARRLAAAGYDVLMPDLHGTGDSSGDFSDGDWEVWLRDIEHLVGTGFRADRPLTLWGCRLGALLALDLVRRGKLPATDLLLWQPAVNGELFMQQFLRLKVAAQMLGAAGEKQTTALLRDRLLGGEGIEVAGYLLSSPLYRAIVATRGPLPAGALRRAALFEVAPTERELSPVQRTLTAQLAAAGAAAAGRCVVGPAFWSTVEIELAPALLDAGDAFFAGHA